MKAPKQGSESPTRWMSNGLPRKGWELVDVEDTEEPNSSCEWCGTSIRYVHYLKHSEKNLTTSCGCICAEHLTQDYVTHRRKEDILKKTARMAKRWNSSPRWNVSQKGSYYRKDQPLYVLIYRKNGAWKIKIGEEWGTKSYQTLDKAKIAALRALNERI